MIIKNKDLFDSGVFVDLHESEIEKIQGGHGWGSHCYWKGYSYHKGDVLQGWKCDSHGWEKLPKKWW